MSFVNIHLKGVYDFYHNMASHTAGLGNSPKIKVLNEMATFFNGELFNICYYEEIKGLVEHLMGVFNRPRVSIQFANISTTGKTVNIDSQDLASKHFVMLPTSTLEENPFTWDKPETIKLPKFPNKCLDNYSIISFPEEAYYLMGEAIAKIGQTLFADLEYPSVPKYYIDPSYMLIKKAPLTIKGDVYNLESKTLLAKFKSLFSANPKLKKVLIPVYYYYHYEQNFQMIGYIKYEIYGRTEEFFKLEFKHYPLKFLQLNDIVTNHKANMTKMMEKVIESLPRYSHNFYFSILKMHNVAALLKKRFKFMFGFSVRM